MRCPLRHVTLKWPVATLRPVNVAPPALWLVGLMASPVPSIFKIIVFIVLRGLAFNIDHTLGCGLIRVSHRGLASIFLVFLYNFPWSSLGVG